MSNNKQSSVEFLTMQLIKNGIITNDDLRQAKAMHKEEIEEAWDKGDYCIDLPDGTWEQKYKSGEHYYNETFGGEK